MKGYKIYIESEYGFEEDVTYSINYDKAIQKFNNYIRKVMSETDLISKEDFSEQIAYFKDNENDYEIICRSYPIFIYKRNNKMIATLMYWTRTSYEYQEYDIVGENIILEEINIEE